MGNWFKFSSQIHNITIDISGYAKSLQTKLRDLASRSEVEKERLSNFVINVDEITLLIDKINFPNKAAILTAINNKDTDKIRYLAFDMLTWKRSVNYNDPQHDYIEKLYKILWDYDTFLENRYYSFDDANQNVKQTIKDTYNNMKVIYKMIEDAINRIKNWNGSDIIISPVNFGSNSDISSERSAYITVGSTNQQTGADSSFAIFVDENWTLNIDDVLEAGDNDFFDSMQKQSDYFTLIRELRKPGSSEQGKTLTLYTARPVQDRQKFINATTVPTNLFLTNNYDSAEGIARDLAGDNMSRDIWKIKIDSKYLIQTLEGMEKQYQVVSGQPEVPIVSMILLRPGEKVL